MDVLVEVSTRGESVLRWISRRADHLNRLGVECSATCRPRFIAILIVIILGAIVALFGILFGFGKYKSAIPLAGSCSAAISAARHPPKDDEDAADKPLMRGVVRTRDSVGHCCFEMTPPVVGEGYR